jgi:pilus assembly protein CpaB
VLLIVIIGLVVGVVVINQILQNRQATESVYVDVYFAQQPIAQGAPITEASLGTMRIPQENVVAVMFTTAEKQALLESDKVAKYPIEQGTPITEALLADPNAVVAVAGPDWATLIPQGMTSLALPTNRLALSAYAVRDGAHININACFLFIDVDPAFQTVLPNLTGTLTGTGFIPEELPVLSLSGSSSNTPHGRLELDPSVQQPYYLLPSEEQRPREVCQMILQDVVVMRLGDFPGIVATPTDENGDPQNSPPDTITLIVTPQDSLTLTYLMYTDARISFTLRNPTDQARQSTEASTLQFLLSQYNIPVPAKLPYAMHPPLQQFP